MDLFLLIKCYLFHKSHLTVWWMTGNLTISAWKRMKILVRISVRMCILYNKELPFNLTKQSNCTRVLKTCVMMISDTVMCTDDSTTQFLASPSKFGSDSSALPAVSFKRLLFCPRYIVSIVRCTVVEKCFAHLISSPYIFFLNSFVETQYICVSLHLLRHIVVLIQYDNLAAALSITVIWYGHWQWKFYACTRGWFV